MTGAGDVVSGIIDVYPVKREAITIPYDLEWINNFIGISITEEDFVNYLTSVALSVDTAT